MIAATHHQHAELRRRDVEPFRHILPDAMEPTGTAEADIALDIDHRLDPRPMGGKRAAVCTTLCDPLCLCRRRVFLRCRKICDLHLLGLFQGEEKLVLG